MVRQVGTALGIAIIGAIFLSQARSHIADRFDRDTTIPAAVKAQVVGHISDIGGGAPTKGGSPALSAIVTSGIADASKPAAGFAGGVVALGALLSLLVPNIPPDAPPGSLAIEH